MTVKPAQTASERLNHIVKVERSKCCPSRVKNERDQGRTVKRAIPLQ